MRRSKATKKGTIIAAAEGRGARKAAGKKAMTSTDPDILGSFAALRQAAKAAFALAKRTGTPFYVMERGRIVNLNPDCRKELLKRAKRDH
jgi:hypothetical protein